MLTPHNLIVGIGTSAGGLDAIQGFFEHLPTDLPCAFIVLQHQRGQRESLLTDLLRHRCNLPTRNASNGMIPDPGVVVVVPPASDVTLTDGRLLLSPAATDTSWFPIDRFFASMAHEFRDHALGIILSGTGSDGTLGARMLKEQGGTVFVQEPSSAGFDGMPNAAIAAGLADIVARPRELAKQLSTICSRDTPLPSDEMPQIADHQRHQILATLRAVRRVDFSPFKETLVDQRIMRRMRFNQIRDTDDYLRLLSQSANEQQRLCNEMLLREAGFFRDTSVFALLANHFEQRLAQHPEDQPFRVWVPGCSTGEEAISLAIVLHEVLAGSKDSPALQIFASDVDDRSLQIARKGLYPNSVSANLTDARLESFFERQEGGWQVSRIIRNNIVFARHDITIDPPYTRLDFIACRNLLSYLQPQIQLNILERLLYTMRSDGELWLDRNEHVDVDMAGYLAVENLPGLYRKTPDIEVVRGGWLPLPMERRTMTTDVPAQTGEQADSQAIQDLLFDNVLAGLDSAALVVDPLGNVVAAHGELDHYLKRRPGGGHTLEKLIRPGLRLELTSLLRGAAKGTAPGRVDDILFDADDGRRIGSIEARRVRGEGRLHNLFTVLLNSTELRPFESPSTGKPIDTIELDSLRAKCTLLEDELRITRTELETAEQQQIGLREQLRTTRDELQGTSEELVAVGRELDSQTTRLLDVSMDYDNLLRETGTGVLVFGMDLKIKRFSRPFDELLGLRKSDIGADLAEFATDRQTADLERDIRNCLESLASRRVVLRRQGLAYEIHVAPYRNQDNAVQGVMVRARRIREAADAADKQAFLVALLGAYEAIHADSDRAQAVAGVLEALLRFGPLRFAACRIGDTSWVRPQSVTLSRELFNPPANRHPEAVTFFDERDIKVLVDGVTARWGIRLSPRRPPDSDGLVVGTVNPDMFSDDCVQRLLRLSRSLHRRIHR